MLIFMLLGLKFISEVIFSQEMSEYISLKDDIGELIVCIFQKGYSMVLTMRL